MTFTFEQILIALIVLLGGIGMICVMIDYTIKCYFDRKSDYTTSVIRGLGEVLANHQFIKKETTISKEKEHEE